MITIFAIAIVILTAIIWDYGLFSSQKKQKLHPMMGMMLVLLVSCIFFFLLFAVTSKKLIGIIFGVTMIPIAILSAQSLVIFFILWRYLKTITLKDTLVVVGGTILLPFIIIVMTPYKIHIQQIFDRLPAVVWREGDLTIVLVLLIAIAQSILFALWFKNRKPSPVGALVAASWIIWFLVLLLNFIYS